MEKINKHTDQVIQQLNRGKRKRQTVVITVFVLVISAALFFRHEIRSLVASSTTSNTDTAITEQPATGITVVKKWELPSELTEISGLANIDNDRFACVQDESGTVFVYNTATSSIESEMPFGPAGDYEGLAVVDKAFWVVRSDGHLFEVKPVDGKKPEVAEYNTHLTAEQNVEGLCYDKTNNRLLLAIKDEEAGNADYKGVYGFDLATRKMPEEPVFKLDLTNKLLAGDAGKTGKKNKRGIKPSAIAINPSTGEVYITDGPKSRLLVTDIKGEIRTLYQLDKNEFAQPEGISFKADGELFISNEGKKQSGNIVNVAIDKG